MRVLLVVTGTHGKTTTASMLAWVLVESGLDPSFIVGGIARNFEASYRLGGGEAFIIEGDEYDSAFFRQEPKISKVSSGGCGGEWHRVRSLRHLQRHE